MTEKWLIPLQSLSESTLGKEEDSADESLGDLDDDNDDNDELADIASECDDPKCTCCGHQRVPINNDGRTRADFHRPFDVMANLLNQSEDPLTLIDHSRKYRLPYEEVMQRAQ
jgi:hypothetical protein